MGSDLKIKKLPFLIGVNDVPGNYGLPTKLPFRLEQDDETGLIRQKYSRAIDTYLRRAYSMGSSLSTPLGRGSFGKRRADEAIKMILMAISKPLRSMDILEVGCGDGYLLAELQNMGAKEVTGCEPGNSIGNKDKNNKITIVKNFFSPILFNKLFDLVLSYGVLEHINQPIESVKSMISCIKDEGQLFIGVPNCEYKMKLGDPGILAHEHWSYFTPNSLKATLLTAGLEQVKVIVGQNGAMVYGWGVKPKTMRKQKNHFIKREKKLYLDFCSKIKIKIPKLQERIDRLLKSGGEIGFYGGGTQLASLLKFKVPLRFFDGDKAKWGKYFPGFNSPIEPAKNLITSPVNELWIIAVDYDREIRNDLNCLQLGDKIKIFSLKRFLGHIY